MSIFRVFGALAIVVYLLSSSFVVETPASKVKSYYIQNLNDLKLLVEELKTSSENGEKEKLKSLFEKSRLKYKQIEFLVNYKTPLSAQKINGAPLKESEASEPLMVIYPTGFQVLEPFIYEDNFAETKEEILTHTSDLLTAINKLSLNQNHFEISESEIMDALKLNLYLMVSKGLAGFDCPTANTAIAEAFVTINTTKTIFSYFDKSSEIQQSCQNALDFIDKSGINFNDFDRATFISQYINPLCTVFKKYQEEQLIPYINQPRAINVKANHLFANDAFDVTFFAPSNNKETNQGQLELGKMLFYDQSLSANGNRSCVTCHKPEKAFTDGLKVNFDITGNNILLRNTPTLVNAALQPVQFYDSRIAFLEDQIHDVVSNKNEMNGSLEMIANRFKKDKKYVKAFADAYQNEVLSPQLIKKALASYIRSLTAMNSSFDDYMRGNKNALNSQEIAGFNLFMGKGKCGSCHFIPLFNGAVPPYYEKLESEVLGVPATKAINPKLDADSGKYHLYKIPHQLFAFKTSTLRNVALTAPYMHNGVFDTLEEVMEFYENGGGDGLNIKLENQTLAPDKLNLTESEKLAIISFLKSLNSRL